MSEGKCQARGGTPRYLCEKIASKLKGKIVQFDNYKIQREKRSSNAENLAKKESEKEI